MIEYINKSIVNTRNKTDSKQQEGSGNENVDEELKQTTINGVEEAEH